MMTRSLTVAFLHFMYADNQNIADCPPKVLPTEGAADLFFDGGFSYGNILCKM
jgi:hypothetical protein